jgi:hypothetical protein
MMTVGAMTVGAMAVGAMAVGEMATVMGAMAMAMEAAMATAMEAAMAVAMEMGTDGVMETDGLMETDGVMMVTTMTTEMEVTEMATAETSLTWMALGVVTATVEVAMEVRERAGGLERRERRAANLV